MRQFLVSIIALLTSVAIMLIGTGLMGTLLSVRLNFETVDPQIKGIILAAYYVGLVAGSQWAGRVIRQVGHIRAFAIFAAACTAAILLQGLYVLPAAWFLLRVLIGFSIAGIYMVVESWLNERADPANRGRVFSLYQVVSYLGLGAGQLLLPFGDPAGTELFMVVAILFALCLVPVALSRASSPPEPAPHTPMALTATLTGSPLAAWTCIASGLMSGALFTLAPAFGLRIGLDVNGVALLMASLIFGGIALQWPIGLLSDRVGRQPMILLAGSVSALLALGIAMLATTVPLELLLAATAIFGGFTFTFYPLAVAQANDRAGTGGDFVAVAAALLFLWGVAAAGSPVLAGLIIAALGGAGLFIYMAVIAAATGAAAWLLRHERAAAHGPYRTMSRTTPAIHELDPRAHADDDQPPPKSLPDASAASDPEDT
ncbi:MFS transporter [Aquisalimonas asiatica]|uniref:Predicted arabinose efflux permease, MFS family n=1 Tax=Aquisalimonas asiatica TaxID=406100 RepID=A0A1H8UKX7_9GAMM|nr:MFS transporter [Aquisalimonas asiatica]SEP03869.1 Predicted arabinose efflux permease, MFS family [Aquisalimonas asiatica]